MTLYTYTQGFGGATNSNMSLTAGAPGLRLVAIDLTNGSASGIANVRLIRAVGSISGGSVSSNLDTYSDGELPATPAATGLYGAVSYAGATTYYLCQWTLAPGAALNVRLPQAMRVNPGNSIVLEAPYVTANLYFEE